MHNIYIHIPFCMRKCGYCSFYSVTDLSMMDAYVGALLLEMDNYADVYGANEIKTVYLGGGTPSLLSLRHLSMVFNRLQSKFRPAGDVEFTIEVNPETVDAKKLEGYRDIGINRISVGVQSFSDHELQYLGRLHSAGKARAVIKSAVEIFDNVGVDLIFGLPHQTEDALKMNISEAVSFSPKHISCYELTFEEGTPLFDDNKLAGDEELYSISRHLIEAAGYKQYEISNYALPGYECRHNLACWSDESYLGLGAAAHSYDREKKERRANVSDVTGYIRGERPAFVERAEEIDKMIMGLRKTDGMPIQHVPVKYNGAIDDLINDGFLRRDEKMIVPTEKGVLFSNHVLREIMMTRKRV